MNGKESSIASAPASVLVDPARGQEWLQRYSDSVLGVFGTPQRVLVRGTDSVLANALRLIGVIGMLNTIAHTAQPIAIRR